MPSKTSTTPKHLKSKICYRNLSTKIYWGKTGLVGWIPSRDIILLEVLKNETFSELEDKSGIFVPKICEDIIENLFVILGHYFAPEEQFMNFLTGNHIEGKINFTGYQNQLAGIFINLKFNGEIILGTHQQTFDFIEQTFLIKGKPICTKQILSYLKDSSKANPKTFIDISI